MFPASGVTTLATAWGQVRGTAAHIKQQSVDLNNASSVTRMTVLHYCNALADALARLDQYAAVTGLAAYAQNELNDSSLNIATEFSTMRTQIVTLQDWIVANFPKDASNNLIVYSFDSTKRFADIALTTAQLSAFKTQLNGLINTIN